MGYGLFKAYSFTMAATAASASVTLGQAFERVYLQVPSMVSSSALDLYVSPDGTQTYYQLRKEVPNTTTVQCWTFTIAASATANGCLVPIPAGFVRYKVVATDSAPTAALGFQVLCGS